MSETETTTEAVAVPERRLSKRQKEELGITRLGNLIPRDELTTIVGTYASESPSLIVLATYLSDERYNDMVLPKLCTLSGVNFSVLAELYRRYYKDKGLIDSAKHIPGVMDDMGVDSRSTTTPCAVCGGEGFTIRSHRKGGDERLKCRFCGGLGMVRKTGDAKAREMFLEAHGVTGKRGPMVGVQVNVGEGSVEATVRDVTSVLEGEVVPASDEAKP